jgi:hypothetical protein
MDSTVLQFHTAYNNVTPRGQHCTVTAGKTLGFTEPLPEMSSMNLIGGQRVAGAYGLQSHRHL